MSGLCLWGLTDLQASGILTEIALSRKPSEKLTNSFQIMTKQLHDKPFLLAPIWSVFNKTKNSNE